MNLTNTKVFIDLDGTLFNDNQGVSPKTIASIKEAIDAGVELYLCSGRPYSYVNEKRKNIDQRLNIISYNGAMINTEVIGIFAQNIVKEIIQEFAEYTLVLKTKTHVYSNNFKEASPFSYDVMVKEKLLNQTEGILKIIIPETKNYDKLTKKLEKYSDKLNLFEYENLGVEIAPIGVDKGLAIKHTLNELDFTIGIGNDLNDLAMFNAVDVKVAMSNSHPTILDSADVITSSNNHDGVAKILDKIKKGEKL